MDHEFSQHGNETEFFEIDFSTTIARLVDVYDGDTITVVMKVFGNFYKFHVRLAGIDTCEMRSKCEWNRQHAIKARNRLFCLATGVEVDGSISIKSYLDTHVTFVELTKCGQDKYSRLLCRVRDVSGSIDFADILVEERLAYQYKGDRKLTEDEQKSLLDVSP